MDQHFGNPVHMAAISMQSPHQQVNQQHYPSHGQYQQYYSDYADSCCQPSAFGDAGFPGEQFGYHSTTSVPYGSGIESYLDPKYTANPAAFASRLPYLPFHAAAVAAYGMYDYSFEPAFIRKRNERERQRVKCVNEGYARLREHLPEEYAEKRLSKVETLRGAIMYIKQLQTLLGFDPEKEKSKRKNIADSKNVESEKDELNTENDREFLSSSADEKEDSGKMSSQETGHNKGDTLSSSNTGQNSHETLCRSVTDNCSLAPSCEKNSFETSLKQRVIPSQRYENTETFSPDDDCSLSPLNCRLGDDHTRNSPLGRESSDHMGSVGGLSSPCSDFRASPNWWTQTNVRPHPTGLDFSDEFHMSKTCVRQDSEAKVDSFNTAFRNARHHPYRGYNPTKSSSESWEDGLLIKTETQTPPPYEQYCNFSNQKDNYYSYRRVYSMGPRNNNVFRSNTGSRGGQSDGFKTDTSPESSSGLSP